MISMALFVSQLRHVTWRFVETDVAAVERGDIIDPQSRQTYVYLTNK